MRPIVSLLFAALLTLAGAVSAPAQVVSPPRGSPQRTAVLDAVRPMVEAELGKPVEFVVDEMRLLGEWAFVMLTPQRPGGGRIEYAYTRYQQAVDDDMFGGIVAALLRQTPKGWLVYEYDLGATDVVWLEWKQFYPVPPEVFPGTDDTVPRMPRSVAQPSRSRATDRMRGSAGMTKPDDVKERAQAALDEILALRKDVARAGQEIYRAWRGRIARAGFAASALNLAHYLALRRHDLRPLQRRLMALGVSSLGRLEGRVLVSLDAVTIALAALARCTAAVPTPAAERQFFRGEARLAANAAAIFGPALGGRAGRIMVTLATESADDPAIVRDLAERGADSVRINCAHDGPQEWQRMIANVRAVERAVGRRLPVLMDIGGPKVRTGRVLTPPDRSRLHIGDLLFLAREIVPQFTDMPFQVTCVPPEILDRIKVGDEASLDDGQLQGPVIGEAHGGFLVRIERGKLAGLKLRPEKGLNFPSADLGLDPLTAKDKADLEFIVAHADLIGHSFVQTAEHVAALQAELARFGADGQRIGIVGKIETPKAVKNLPEIIVQAAGHQPFAVMIARGDLAVEMGFERVAEMQEEIMWLCEAAHVPVIWATQVLEELVKKGLPSRGEMTDAAMAARAECVLLNKGPNVGAAVGVLDRLLRRMGEHQVKKTPTLRALHAWSSSHPAGRRPAKGAALP